MNRSVNKVYLLGRTGRDAEVKFAGNGTAITTFSLATDYSYKNKSSGEYVTNTEWTNCVMFGNEKLAEYIKKGRQIHVEGRLQTRKYEAKDGTQRTVTEVVCDQVILCGGEKSERSESVSRTAPAREPSVPMDDSEDCPF